MRKPGHVFLLAIVIGALSAALVYRHIRALRAEIDAARRVPDPTVDVVVARDTIPAGARIEAAQVRLVAWPENALPEGAIRDPRAVVDGVARVTIEKNQPLNGGQLVGPGAGLLAPMIAGGMRAMSVRVDDVTGVSGFITPNSRVDVLVAGPTDGNSQEQRSKLILQNVRVLATGKSIEQRDDKPVEVPTVTLLVTPDDAEKLTLAVRYEPVRLALRNTTDDSTVGTPGVTAAALFVDPARPAEPPPSRGGRRARHGMQVLLGERMTEQDIFQLTGEKTLPLGPGRPAAEGQ